jgi:hypothetical protein
MDGDRRFSPMRNKMEGGRTRWGKIGILLSRPGSDETAAMKLLDGRGTMSLIPVVLSIRSFHSVAGCK